MKTFVKMHFGEKNVFEIVTQRKQCGAGSGGFERERERKPYAADKKREKKEKRLFGVGDDFGDESTFLPPLI